MRGKTFPATRDWKTRMAMKDTRRSFRKTSCIVGNRRAPGETTTGFRIDWVMRVVTGLITQQCALLLLSIKETYQQQLASLVLIKCNGHAELSPSTCSRFNREPRPDRSWNNPDNQTERLCVNKHIRGLRNMIGSSINDITEGEWKPPYIFVAGGSYLRSPDGRLE